MKKVALLIAICLVGACNNTGQQNRGTSLAGGMLEGVVDLGLKKVGINADYKFRNTMRAFLTEGIASALDEREQKKAADTTVRVAGKSAGTKDNWSSDTRTGVSGSSEVTSTTRTTDGTVCSKVRDIVIVEGEERTEVKTLCRAPGATGFTLQS